MFSRSIPAGNMKLTSPTANNIFNISGDYYNGDATFVATMRALLGKRIPEDTSIHFSLTRSSLDSYRLDGLDFGIVYKIFSIRKDENFPSNYIYLHSLESNTADNERAMAMLDTEMAARGFESKEDLKMFFGNRKITSRFYINNELQTTVIIVAGCMCNRTLHVLQTMMPRYFMWFFKGGLTEKDKQLVRSLGQDSPDEYERIINEFAADYDFRSYAIKTMCGDFEGRVIRDELEEKKNQFERIQRSITESLNEYHRLLNNMNDMNVRIMGLEAKLHDVSGQNALVDFFTSCKNLIPVSLSGGELTFIVQTYLTNFSPDMFETMSANGNSHFYTDYGYTKEWEDPEKRRKFLNAIFSDEAVLKIKVCGVYVMNTRGYIEAISSYSYPEECKDYMPNPHLQYFSCLGNHEQLINDRLKDHDYVGAVVQCIGSAGSVNLSEGVTIRRMLGGQIFSGNQRKIIELPDGTSVTPTEAYEWLVAQEKNEEVTDNA